mmetsp:Transcript_86903/g.246376  ORF Transcript_86903/g.246376 Transcript_86903/m.246376 type:complete len:280 (-) Transcript_86903:276-1115(-)
MLDNPHIHYAGVLHSIARAEVPVSGCLQSAPLYLLRRQQQLHESSEVRGWQREEGRASVQREETVLAEHLLTNNQCGLEGPPLLNCHGHVHKSPAVAAACVRQPPDKRGGFCLVRQEETEGVLMSLACDLREDRLPAMAEGWEGQAEHTLEEGIVQTAGRRHKHKLLSAHAHAANREGIHPQLPRHGAHAVADPDMLAAALGPGAPQGPRRFGLESGVADPQVRGARVEDHGDGLPRRSQLECAEVLHIGQVPERLHCKQVQRPEPRGQGAGVPGCGPC